MVKLFICIFSFLLFIRSHANSQVKLPSLVRDSMVLQRDAPIRIWGWAARGEKVRVRFNDRSYSTAAGADGKWIVILAAMKAGGPYSMNIDASNHLLLKDILIGDVWLCSGQSNMVHQMILHRERYVADIATADYPQIRQFRIPTLTNLQGPVEELPAGYWKTANPEDVLQFSAVAYFFARKIYRRYHVPIGLINASVGGAPIQAWISEDGLKEFPEMGGMIKMNKDSVYIHSLNRGGSGDPSTRKQEEDKDKGLTGALPWYDKSYSPKGWRSITVPGYWEDQGGKGLHGVVWYRREITVPAALADLPAKLALGRIVDADIVYVNGRQVGQTAYQYPQRRYLLPAGTLSAGKNVLVVRVVNHSGKGGFVPDKPYYLAAGKDTIDLGGSWEYKVGCVFAPVRSGGGNGSGGFSAENSPAALYNAMVAPIKNYTIRGYVWYQGESNTGNPKEYGSLMPALIRDWRDKWGQRELPFLFAQLPNFMDVQYLPVESLWAETRAAQFRTLAVPNTGMAVTIDLGEWNDLHPDRKKDVGERLALWAERLAYGDTGIVASGPLYRSSRVEGNTIIVELSNTGKGLVAKDGEELSEFAIAGADRKFVWAKAKIEGDRVNVWNDAIAHPLYVRYAWADNPDNPNLYNKDGLPASPFETELILDDSLKGLKAKGEKGLQGEDEKGLKGEDEKGLKEKDEKGLKEKGLKDYYNDYFPIGVSVSPRALKSEESSLVIRNFNSLSPENAMKMGPIHPRENEYYFKDADSILAFAQRNGMKVRGHTLCWHNQTPAWLFVDPSGKAVSKDVLLQRLKDHITTVVSRYKGKVYAWDVVNEAISDKAGEFLRPSKWLEIAGEEFISMAFRWAHAADPDALLFYNDYNEINPVKREKIYRLIKKLKEDGIPVNGLGLQGHWAVTEPTAGQLDSTLQLFSGLGVKLQITELDVSVYPKEHERRERRPEDANADFTPEREERQLEKYKMCFALFRKYRSSISGVTFWNISDRRSWLDDFPVSGRKDYPLLFDKDLKPKKVYWEVVKF